MNNVANQLKKLIKINRTILNQLNKDEADINLLQKRFEERGEQADVFAEITSQADTETLTKQEKKSLQKLFSRFERQQQKIQQTLDYILKESKKRLDEAIKSNKAEKSYQLLQR